MVPPCRSGSASPKHLPPSPLVRGWALFLTVSTGIFMACGVAIKIYYLNVFWYKMLALSAGVAFVYGIRRPLLRQGLDAIHPRIVKLVAVASLMLWFTVAATGRWIGFSG